MPVDSAGGRAAAWLLVPASLWVYTGLSTHFCLTAVTDLPSESVVRQVVEQRKQVNSRSTVDASVHDLGFPLLARDHHVHAVLVLRSHDDTLRMCVGADSSCRPLCQREHAVWEVDGGCGTRGCRRRDTNREKERESNLGTELFGE